MPGARKHRGLPPQYKGVGHCSLYQVRKTASNAKAGKMVPRVEPREPSGSSTGMPFIVSLNAENADPATRKLIRSHVMRGKKQKKSPPDKRQPITSSGPVTVRNQAAAAELEEVMQMYTSLVPGRVGTDLSFVKFASEIQLSILLNMAKGMRLIPILRWQADSIEPSLESCREDRLPFEGCDRLSTTQPGLDIPNRTRCHCSSYNRICDRRVY